MKPPILCRLRHSHSERGVTMILVAIAMVAIIAMAALSIDVVTLYLAREEAQRSADAAALTAARLVSISGLTGDPNNSANSWQAICGGAASPATKAATAIGSSEHGGRHRRHNCYRDVFGRRSRSDRRLFVIAGCFRGEPDGHRSATTHQPAHVLLAHLGKHRQQR